MEELTKVIVGMLVLGLLGLLGVGIMALPPIASILILLAFLGWIIGDIILG